MCSHKWKIFVSYRHPYMMSKMVVCKKCELCGQNKIDNKFSLLGFGDFTNELIKPKNKVYKKDINKVA